MAPIEARFAREGYRPGDVVDGVVEFVEQLDGVRSVEALLAYVDRSLDFDDATAHDAASLHEGPIEVGQELPFALRLPEDALPDWHDPSVTYLGSLGWALVVKVDVEAWRDTTIEESLPLAPDAAWRGPAAASPGLIQEAGPRWDVAVTPERRSARRGEGLGVAVAIAAPDAERAGIQVGLRCRVRWAEKKKRTHGNPEFYLKNREIKQRTVLEEWMADVDGSLPEQTVSVTFPADGPFSYDGKAFGFTWYLVAKEDRRLRMDPGIAIPIHVSP